MQADLDGLEQDCARLKNSPANAAERSGMSKGGMYYRSDNLFPQIANAAPVHELVEQPVVEGNIETSYLLDQVWRTAFLICCSQLRLDLD